MKCVAIALLASTAPAVDVSKKSNIFPNVNTIANAVHKAEKAKKHPMSNARMETIPMLSFPGDCWKDRPVATAFLQQENPGAGMQPETIKPYVTVEKDGFFEVACQKDQMLLNGDKFGNGKHSYKMGDVSNVSIVHYSDHVAKEDQKPMTHKECFEFCRTVPEMLFFGLNAGRDCYCAPFYKETAGDSSNCDLPCQGDPTTMCGGMVKSSLFGMHSCSDTEQVFEDATSKATEALEVFQTLLDTLKETAETGETDANACQKSLGSAGDPTASGLMQDAKIYAGELIHAAEDGVELLDNVKGEIPEEGKFEGKNMKDFKVVKEVEAAVRAMEEGTVEVELRTEELQSTLDEAAPEADPERVAGSADQYVPLMTFVDKEFIAAPSTCGGDVVQTLFGKSLDDCAAACDAQVGKCVGISYFGQGNAICFLFEKFKSVQYWTGCEDEAEADFLQTKKTKKEAPFLATCVAKLADFEGTTLKPDKSGKCKMCLKEATKADRCFSK